MEEIRSIDATRLTTGEHGQFMGRLIDYVMLAGAGNLKIEDIFGEFIFYYNKEKELVKVTTKSGKTVTIKDIDGLRDNTYSAIRMVTDCYTKHFDPIRKAAAEAVKLVFDKFGNIGRKTYKEETFMLRSAAEKLLAENRADLEKLGLLDWLMELIRLNDWFEEESEKRVDEELAKAEGSLRETRLQVDSRYYKITKRVNAYIEMGGADACREFVKKLNSAIDEYSRAKPKPSGDSGETPPPAETPVEPTEPETPAEDKYPDAIEWVANFGVANATDGMIFYIMVDGEKVFYKLLDRAAVGFVPGGEKYQELWEKLS
jgi:hypothetical protein